MLTVEPHYAASHSSYSRFDKVYVCLSQSCHFELPKLPAVPQPCFQAQVLSDGSFEILQKAAMPLDLLTGVASTGCGKTALVEELARVTGNVDMVRVHVDDQMDSKSLLGAYVCTSNPEEFVWQPGPLTQVNTRRRCCDICGL